MLKGISPLLFPELLKVLAEMGHGDEIVLSDAHFPAYAAGVPVLQAAGVDFKRLTFPRYADDSSMLVRMYLRGDFGTHPEDVNPYAASTFYAADRYASFKTDWQKDWEQDRVIFCNRYTTSNAVHQSSKLPAEQLVPFTDWLFDYE